MRHRNPAQEHEKSGAGQVCQFKEVRTIGCVVLLSFSTLLVYRLELYYHPFTRHIYDRAVMWGTAVDRTVFQGTKKPSCAKNATCTTNLHVANTKRSCVNLFDVCIRIANYSIINTSKKCCFDVLSVRIGDKDEISSLTTLDTVNSWLDLTTVAKTRATRSGYEKTIDAR